MHGKMCSGFLWIFWSLYINLIIGGAHAWKDELWIPVDILESVPDK